MVTREKKSPLRQRSRGHGFWAGSHAFGIEFDEWHESRAMDSDDWAEAEVFDLGKGTPERLPLRPSRRVVYRTVVSPSPRSEETDRKDLRAQALAIASERPFLPATLP